LDTRQGDLGLKKNGQHRKRNRAAAIAMEAAIEELTPLRVLKQPQVLGTWPARAGEVPPNSAGATHIEGRAVPKFATPAVPPPARKLGFDQPDRSVDRARYIGGSRAKCTHELAVEFGRANASGFDFLQKFPQVHFFVILKHARVQAENLKEYQNSQTLDSACVSPIETSIAEKRSAVQWDVGTTLKRRTLAKMSQCFRSLA
jgi:hypothetical protein